MGRFFSDGVEEALKCIFYNMRAGDYDGKRGLELLKMELNERNNGDAAYFLSRCFAGSQYVWEGHGFIDDDAEVIRLMRKSVELGSAIGVVGAMRATGILTPTIWKNMPFKDAKQAWDIVKEKADQGEAFCQYAIGNSYFWGDILKILNQTKDDFASPTEFDNFLSEQIYQCIPYFEKAFENGVYFGGKNLAYLYTNGSGDLCPPQPERYAEITFKGARLGYPNYQLWYACDLSDEKKHTEALLWFKKAYDNGNLEASMYIGNIYAMGKGTEVNFKIALEWLEKAMKIKTDNPLAFNSAGKIYYTGDDNAGIPKDYAKALYCFNEAYERNNTWGNDMQAHCYLEGYGCEKDYRLALFLLNEGDWTTPLKCYCLGRIYTEGLDVPENISMGVTYLQKAAEFPEAKTALLGYKKNLFGKWVRRK